MARDVSDPTPIGARDELVAWIAEGEKPRGAGGSAPSTRSSRSTADDLRRCPTRASAASGRCSRAAAAHRLGADPGGDGQPIALFDDGGGGAISLEPGGQFELSGAPVETLHETCGEVDTPSRRGARRSAGRSASASSALGIEPEMEPRRDAAGCRSAATDHARLHAEGRQARPRHDVPHRTVQVNLDFATEADMVRKMRVSLALQPVATALFANSPFTEGKPNGFLSMRSRDLARHRPRPHRHAAVRVRAPASASSATSSGRSTCRCTSSTAAARYHDVAGASFRDFLAGRLAALPGERPTLTDWANHLSTAVPGGPPEALPRDARRRWRAAGAASCALPALWVGLLYDHAALDAAWDWCTTGAPRSASAARRRCRSGARRRFARPAGARRRARRACDRRARAAARAPARLRTAATRPSS